MPPSDMPEDHDAAGAAPVKQVKVRRVKQRLATRHKRYFVRVFATLCGLALLVGAACGWLAYRAFELRTQFTAASALLPEFKTSFLEKDPVAAQDTLNQIRRHTSSAKSAATDPLWLAASTLPWAGPNFSALTEVALSAHDVVDGAAKPLVGAANSVEWEKLTPVDGRINLAPLATASPSLVAAANTIELTHSRLEAIDRSRLLPEISQPLDETIKTLDDLRSPLRVAADTSRILPSMLGSAEARNYLVLVQNSAEVRATGGLPGALALLRVKDGVMQLESQVSGASLGRFTPPVEVDAAQRSIYTNRLGAFISDVNLTPDFPTAALSAKSMWETRYDTEIDGVVALDPVVLSHFLEASGPIPVTAPINNRTGTPADLPVALSADNVVETLLADTYLTVDSNEAQDEYFASASSAIFGTLASGKIPGKSLVQALVTSANENRIYLWSARKDEQKVLAASAVGGSVTKPVTGGSAFGVYFNDGTGAKMDYYVRRTVQLEQICSGDGYSQYKVKIKLTNTAPPDAGTAFPAAVTGGGLFGTAPGSVQTNVMAYGPTLSQMDTVSQDGNRVSFGSHVHSGRPLGMVAVKLAPGESTALEMTFVKVVQDAEPNLLVTPTVQAVKEVTLPTQMAICGP